MTRLDSECFEAVLGILDHDNGPATEDTNDNFSIWTAVTRTINDMANDFVSNFDKQGPGPKQAMYNSKDMASCLHNSRNTELVGSLGALTSR
jgi:hypothetical protein